MRTTAFLVLLSMLVGCAPRTLSIPASEGLGVDANDCVFYGDNYVFALSKPVGWAVDNESARDLGIDAVFFPLGSSWTGPVTMYPRVWQKESTLSLASVMEADLQQYQEGDPTVTVQEVAPIEISPSLSGTVRYFNRAQPELHEAVAYIDSELTVSVLVLRATTQPGFEEALPKFAGFVRSYRPMKLPARGAA